jgi:hypothetical protein
MRIYNENKIFYIYEYLRNKDSDDGLSGTPYYIGKGSNERVYSKNRTIKPPADANRIKIICKNMTEPDAFQLEILLIHLYGRVDNQTGCLHNKTNGGDGISGYTHSEQTKQKQSIAAKRRKPVSIEVRKKMSERMRNLSKEERLKLSFPRKNRPLSDNHKLKISLSGIGRVVTTETRRKIAIAKTGKRPSKETIQKLSESHLGISNGNHSQETKNKISESVRKHWASIKHTDPK